MDLQKAFSTLLHDVLLEKLLHYGVTVTTLQWFNSYSYSYFLDL